MKTLLLSVILCFGIYIISHAQLQRPDMQLPTGNEQIKLDSIVNYYMNTENDSLRLDRAAYFYYQDEIIGKDTSHFCDLWSQDENMYKRYHKHFKSYNSNNDQIEYYCLEYNINNNNTIHFLYGNKYEYDENQNIIKEIWLSPSGNGDTLAEHCKREYIFEGEKLLSFTTFIKNNLDQWYIQDKTEFSYSEDNILSSETSQILDTISNSWIYNTRLDYAYNDQETLSCRYGSKYENDEWVKSFKTEFEYDSYQNLIQEYGWSKNGNDWTLKSKYDVEYNNNHMISYQELWGNSLSEGFEGFKEEYSWDDNGNMIELIYSSQSYQDETWSSYRKDSYLYVEDLLQTKTTQKWDETITDWTNIYIELYNYSDNGFIIYRKQTWIEENEPWSTVRSSKYYYSPLDLTSIHEDPIFENIDTYPNPSRGIFKLSDTFNTSTVITIYNNNGQIVRTMNLNAFQSKINLSDLKNGIYHMTIRNDQGLRKSKLVIQK
ncbi:MAG: T9SS type A sorting domain-containing protein [Bacteroidales bacterium]|nr:T9SS type A sorting domain-containing protein [Bacteroidales bacterium]